MMTRNLWLYGSASHLWEPTKASMSLALYTLYPLARDRVRKIESGALTTIVAMCEQKHHHHSNNQLPMFEHSTYHTAQYKHNTDLNVLSE